MARTNIRFDTIFKRSSCLNSASNDLKESDYSTIIDSIDEQLKSDNKPLYEHRLSNMINSFMDGISNYQNANKYYRQPLYYIQEYNDINPKMADIILKHYTDRILPYVEDLSMMDETVDRYYLNENQRDCILESVKKYITVDRILANHNKISKRFNITSEISKVKSKGLKSVVESCCSMIDTYTIAPYAKFNLCLEEMGYLLDKEGIEYNKKEFVKYVTEYFLLRSPILSSKDLNGYRTVLNENCYINEEDIEDVSFTLSNEINTEYHSITKEIQKFLVTQEKDIDILNNTVSNFLLCSYNDLKNNLSKVIMLIFDVYKNQIIDNIDSYIDIWFRDILERLQKDDFSKSDLQNIVMDLTALKNSIFVSSSDEYEYGVLVGTFKNKLEDFIDSIESSSFNTYSKENIDALNFVNNESANIISFNEYKVFKFHNLIRASINLDKYLKYKTKNVSETLKKKYKNGIAKANNILFGESDLYSIIGEDAKADLCAVQYILSEDVCDADIDNYLVDICKEFNSKLITEGFDSIRCYYIINGNIAEIHLKESSIIDLSEDDWSKVRSSYSKEFDLYCEQFAYYTACIESMENINSSVEKILVDFSNNDNLTLEHYEVAMEALSLLNVDYDTVSVFSENFSNYYYNTAVLESVITEEEFNKSSEPKIRIINKNWVQEKNVPLDIQLDAFNILSAVLEAPEIKKPKVGPGNINKQKPNVNNHSNNDNNDSDKDNNEKKNPFKGINLKSMKLYLLGLKQNAKKFSQKEREISRTVDNEFRRLVKGMKDALISDRREAIIKGSVIPSFSKCIKIGLALVGMGWILKNPITPVLVAFGGFAVSKKLTKRERVLLLDEIETELQVVDKEISNAESKNQMKKYRELLKYKKDLQRQYQRIRYNIRVGKDILPNSSVGVKSFDD